MDVVDKVSSVANEQNWRAQHFKHVDEMVDAPSETYPESVRYCLNWQVPFTGAIHLKVAGSGDINILDSYKAFRKGFKRAGYNGVKDKTYLQSRMTSDLTGPPHNFQRSRT